MTEPKATYSMPVCKLCGGSAVAYDTQNEAGIKYHCASDECTLCLILFTESEWRKLMGEPEPDTFWDWPNSEECGFQDVDMFASEYADAHLEWNESVELRIQCAKNLKDRRMRITAPEEGQWDAKWEWIE